MLKEGAVNELPSDLAPHIVHYTPQNDDELSLWVYACLENQGLSCPLTREPNTLQTDLRGTSSHMQFICDCFFERAGDCIVLGNRGGGKCLGRGTPVMMWDGSVKAVEDVEVGDLLMGDDSTPRKVLTTTHGVGPLYKVTPIKGDPYIVNDVHILSLKYGHHSKVGGVLHDGDVKDISVQDYLKLNKTHQEILKGYRVPVATFGGPKRVLPVPPYLLGLWLGDGSRYNFSITTPEPEIVSYLYDVAEEYDMDIRVQKERVTNVDYATYVFKGKQLGCHNKPMWDYIRSARLTDVKYIPYEYKTASWSERLELLAGLLDTDGSLTHSGATIEFSSKFPQLAYDVAYIARSVGLAAYVKQTTKTCTNASNGPKVGTYYRMHISGDTSIIPMRVERKRPHPRQQVKDVLLTGITVEPVGTGDYYGFTIDGNRRFLLGDFTVTHNTVTFAITLFLDAWFKPGIEVAHLGAIEDQARRCYRYFRKITDHPLFQGGLSRPPTASRADFSNGSSVEILVGTMAGVNGPHPAHVQIDEVELMDWTIMQEAFNMARSAKGYKGSTRLTSTRKKASGTMQRLIDEAQPRGFKIYQWNLWDTVETCPLSTDRDGYINDQQTVYTGKDSKGEDISYGIYTSCVHCPLLPACHGQAKTSNAGSNAVVTIDDAKKLYKSLDPEVWDAQVICVRPGRSNLIYPMFDPDIHVVDYQEVLRGKYGDDYPEIFDTAIDVYAGQDAGFGCPATAFLQVFNDPDTGEQMVIIFDELYEKNIAPSKYVKEFLVPRQNRYNVEEWFCDPSNSQQLMAEMDLCDLYTIPGLKNVDEGLDIVKALFSMGRLLIDRNCKNLIWELGHYEKLPNGKPRKINDHLVDAVRFGVSGVGIYDQVLDEVYY